MTRRRAQLATRATLLSLGGSLLLACATSPPLASDGSGRANPPTRRVEDRSLHSRLGGRAALAAIAGAWAERTQTRTRLAYNLGIGRAQHLLSYAVGPGPGESPLPVSPPSEPNLDGDSPAELLSDLAWALRSLRITAPEQIELLQKLRQILSPTRRDGSPGSLSYGVSTGGRRSSAASGPAS